MLALPFSIGRRRNLRAYRFGVALAILIAYHEVAQQGAVMTQSYGYSPYLTLWLPFAALFGFSVWRFWMWLTGFEPIVLMRCSTGWPTWQAIRRHFTAPAERA